MVFFFRIIRCKLDATARKEIVRAVNHRSVLLRDAIDESWWYTMLKNIPIPFHLRLFFFLSFFRCNEILRSSDWLWAVYSAVNNERWWFGKKLCLRAQTLYGRVVTYSWQTDNSIMLKLLDKPRCGYFFSFFLLFKISFLQRLKKLIKIFVINDS